jgi:hypothetical protein
MNHPNTTQFVEKFTPKNQEHVMWLKKMGEEMAQLDPMKQMDLCKLVNQNPMKVMMKNPLDWVYIHFSLVMKYTNAVLAGDAWVPPQK